MARVFAELPEALAATRIIAERCHLDLQFDRLNFPRL
jgi:DNA polymerase III alpha subunit